jgi:hypothetical protein
MDIMKTIRGLFGSGKAEKQAEQAAQREDDQRSDDAFRKAMKGN